MIQNKRKPNSKKGRLKCQLQYTINTTYNPLKTPKNLCIKYGKKMFSDDFSKFVFVFCVRYKPSVPNHEFLIIGDRAKKRFMQQMPSYILDDRCVTSEDCFSVNYAIFLRRRIDVPQTNCMIVGSAQ